MPNDRPKKDSLNNGTEEETQAVNSSCSLFAVLSLLVLILALLIGGVFYLKYKGINWSKLSIKTDSAKDININDRFKESIKNQSGEETITLTISESDLSKSLRLEDSNFPLKHPSIKISSDKIVLSGKTGNSFLSLGIDINLMPKVKDGSIAFEITEIRSASMVAPKKVSDELSVKLEPYLTVAFPEIAVTDIKLNNSFINLIGKRKQ